MSSTAADITKRAKSNLAFALKVLPKNRREDMLVFYAFCRTIDDIADDDGLPIEQRAAELQDWNYGLIHGFENPSPLQNDVLEMCDRNEIRLDLMLGLIEGCLMDLYINRIESWELLEKYIWKVACTVGLVSVRLFGCRSPESKSYAIELAKALQLTNIMRDVGEDYQQRGRIYLPLQDLQQFGYSEQDLANQVHDERFLELMKFQAVRAQNFFGEAALHLSASDHSALRPARIMSDIYQDLLNQMSHDGFRVFDKRYRVSNWRKMMYFIKHLFT